MKFTQGMGRTLSDARARQVIGFVGALALISIAQPAFADGTAIFLCLSLASVIAEMLPLHAFGEANGRVAPAPPELAVLG